MSECTTPKELSEEHLAPVRAWVHANRGSIQRLATKMAAASGQSVNRHMVARWLNEDPEKRIQPTHGYALLLEKCVAELQDEDTKKNDKKP